VSCAQDCFQEVVNGIVDWTVADPTMLYFLNDEYGGTPKSVTPFAQEFRVNAIKRSGGTGSGEGADYYSVALIRAEDCRKAPQQKYTLASAKGRRSCHTRYGDLASWAYPVNYLVQHGLSDGSTDLEIIHNFFNTSCAPSNGDVEICSGCEHKDKCNLDDNFAGDDGVLKCLQSGQGDIAFMDHFAAEAASISKSRFVGADNNQRDFRLVCVEGCESIAAATRVRSLPHSPACACAASVSCHLPCLSHHLAYAGHT
jgi:hypothetical protein